MSIVSRAMSIVVAALMIMGLSAPAVTQEKDDISGDWVFVLDTPDGERRSSVQIQLDGENVRGKWDSADLKGTFVNGKLDLSFTVTSNEGGMTATLKIKGKMENGALKGDWTYGEYGGTYTAKRKG